MPSIRYLDGATVDLPVPVIRGIAPDVVRVKVRIGWLRTTTVEVPIPRAADGTPATSITVPIQLDRREPMTLRLTLPAWAK